ncbi:hypothetical protein [Pyrococcus abyssi]|nr:hypothetical protein [Pyrococcus abyssi]
MKSLEEKLALLYPFSIKEGEYEWIVNKMKKLVKDYHAEPYFDRHMRESIDDLLSGEYDIAPKMLDDLVVAAVVYELYRRDPTYFDFVKPGNVADTALETFDYLLNQGKAREVYRRFEEFLEKPLSQVPEFQRLVEFLDKYAFTPYKEGIKHYDPELWRKLLDRNGTILGDGIAIYTEIKNGGIGSKRDRYEYRRLMDKFENELLPDFAKVIAKKTEEYLKKLGVME